MSSKGKKRKLSSSEEWDSETSEELNSDSDESFSMDLDPLDDNEKGRTGTGIEINKEIFDENLSFRSIGGLDEIKKTLIVSVISKFIGQKSLTNNKANPKGLGVVFYGPPGTGKTLMAKCLIAELNRNLKSGSLSLYSITGDQKSKYYGESEKIIQKTFEEAKLNSPSVILIDEMESLGGTREGNREEANMSTVAQLLVEVQNLDETNVLVIGITNMLHKIDPALLRPGRLGLKLQFLPPTTKGRLEILKDRLSKWKTNKRPSEEIIEKMAEETIGFTGADLHSLVENVVDKAMTRTLNRKVNNVKSALKKLDIQTLDILDEDWLSEMKTMKPTNISCFDSCLYVPRPPTQQIASNLFSEIEKEINDLIPDLKTISNDKAMKPILVWGKKNDDIDLYLLPTVLNNLSNKFALYSVNKQHIFAADQSKAKILSDAINQSIASSQPSILFLPSVDTWWSGIHTVQKESLRDIFHKAKQSQVVIIATSSMSSNEFKCPILQKIFDRRISASVEFKDFTPKKISTSFKHLLQFSLENLLALLAGSKAAKMTPSKDHLKEIFGFIETIAQNISIELILQLAGEIEEQVSGKHFATVKDFLDCLLETVLRYC